MKAENNKMVAVDYTLTVDGKIADRSRPGQPLEFIFGTGMLLPKFEAAIVGKLAAERAAAKGITMVSFDRNGYLYHGRVKQLAEAAREGGLKF